MIPQTKFLQTTRDCLSANNEFLQAIKPFIIADPELYITIDKLIEGNEIGVESINARIETLRIYGNEN